MQLFGIQSGLSGVNRQAVTGPGTPGVGGAGFTGSAGTIIARPGVGAQFAPGQTLFGQVAGKSNDGSFMLRLGGTTLQANSRVPLSVGQPIHVAVQGQQSGVLLLKLVDSAFTPMSSQDVGQAFAKLGMPETEANMFLATSLVEHGAPLTKDVFTTLRNALAQLPQNVPGNVASSRVGAAWFLQSNQLPLTPQNITVLGNFIAAHPQLGQQLFTLQSDIKKIISNPGLQSEKSLEVLNQVPGLLGEMILEQKGAKPQKPSKKLFDLARQVGIEPNLGQAGGGEDSWDILQIMRQLRNGFAADTAKDGALAGLMSSMKGLEENLQALKLINNAGPDAGLAFYYLQVPLGLDSGEFAEVWIRYRRDENGEKIVDPDDLRLEFYISTEFLGDLVCVLETKYGVADIDIGADNDILVDFIEQYIPVLVQRITDLGWIAGNVQASLKEELSARHLVERQDISSMETVNVQA